MQLHIVEIQQLSSFHSAQLQCLHDMSPVNIIFGNSSICGETERFDEIIQQGTDFMERTGQVVNNMQQCPASKLTHQHARAIGNCPSYVTIFCNHLNQNQSPRTALFTTAQSIATLNAVIEQTAVQ
jgi:hypothetical protein